MSLSALKGLIIKLGGLREGRKALILVSEGYTNYLPPQMRSQNAQIKGGSADPFAGDSMVEQRERFFSQAEMISRLKDVYDLANRNNVSIYALDPRGLAAFEGDIDEGVAGISLTTDKEMLRLTMDSHPHPRGQHRWPRDRQLERSRQGHAADRARSERVLPDRLQLEACPGRRQFHEIKVKVTRPGVEVRHRKGYRRVHQRRPDPRDDAPEPRPPEGCGCGAGLGGDAAARRLHSLVARHVARQQRQDEADVRLGARARRQAREEPAKITLTAIGPDGAPYFRGKSPSAGTGPAMSEGMISVDGPAPAPAAAGTGGRMWSRSRSRRARSR